VTVSGTGGVSDVDDVIERVDVNEIVRRTELDALIARSTAGVATQVLDVARANLVTIDQAVQGVPARLLRAKETRVPATPVDPSNRPDLAGLTPRARATALQGHYAGSVSRFLAFVVDQFLIGILFGIGASLVAGAVEVVMNRQLDVSDGRWQVALAYALWAYLDVAVQLAGAGRTVGKAILGLLVVRSDGDELTPKQAFVRPLVFPLSFMLFGIGFLIGLFRRDRRQLHDLLARTAVVYAWDAGTAQLREEAGRVPSGVALAEVRPLGENNEGALDPGSVGSAVEQQGDGGAGERPVEHNGVASELA
jgi:uncharacterized RDD family membrane protein YckC